MPKVFNIFNAPKGKTSPSGEEIYKWTFLDKDGKEQKDEKNVKEEINSYLPRVDYKSQIKRGELEYDNISGELSKDYRNVPVDTVDLYKYLAALGSMDKDQVSNLLEQVTKASQNSVQAKQTGDSSETQGGTTPQENVSEQPTDSKTNTSIVGGQK